MRVAALVSGGKDSVLALECMRMSGYDVTHVVQVRVRADDSLMFHLPNADAVRLVAEALGLPRHVVEVSGEPEREVEELEDGLRGLPVDALCSGAVASEYQRTRIERVGHRLGLRTFAPLWHKPAEEILATVGGPGWDVRFAAVAAEGLDARWLGRRLDPDAARELLALRARWGVHPAGEGGEYETLVLDAPGYRARIEPRRARALWERDRGTWVVEEAALAPKAPPPATPWQG